MESELNRCHVGANLFRSANERSLSYPTLLFRMTRGKRSFGLLERGWREETETAQSDRNLSRKEARNFRNDPKEAKRCHDVKGGSKMQISLLNGIFVPDKLMAELG